QEKHLPSAMYAIASPRVSYATRSSWHARLNAYLPIRQVRNVYAQYVGIRTKIFGGVETMDDNGAVLKNIEECSDIVIGLPGRIKALVDFGFVHSLWKEIPRSAQVMSFSSTLDIRARKWCKGLMVKPRRRHYEQLEFSLVCIFVKSSLRAEQFNKVLLSYSFPSIAIISRFTPRTCANRCKDSRDFNKHVLVTTDSVSDHVDVSRASLVIKYDVLGDAFPGKVWITLQNDKKLLLIDPKVHSLQAAPVVLKEISVPAPGLGPHYVGEYGNDLWASLQDSYAVLCISHVNPCDYNIYQGVPRPVFVAQHPISKVFYTGQDDSSAIMRIDPKTGSTTQYMVPPEISQTPVGMMSSVVKKYYKR
ncbi:hypothetical protein CPC16_002737, partial [Podila verticillata]